MTCVSVVIPTRNRPHLVLRAVRSALAQVDVVVEVIVIVDGIDPSTTSELASMNDDRIRPIVLPTSVGGASARNAGVSAARYDWIAFLDDDDEWAEGKLSAQLAAAIASDCAYPIVSCRVNARAPHVTYLWPRRLPAKDEPICDYLFMRRGLFQGEALLQTSTLLTTRATLTQIPFSPNLSTHQDWDWLIRASSTPGAQVMFVDQPLVTWYIEEPRSSLGSAARWTASLAWIQSMSTLVTPSSYSAFVLTSVSALAADQARFFVFFQLLAEAFRGGRPRALDVVLHLGFWLVPRSFRRRLRSVFSTRRFV